MTRPDLSIDSNDVDVQFGHLTSPFGVGKA
jgi:hypothetical protein